MTERQRQIVSSSYKGSCGDKIATLSGYRFALCFENTQIEGYVTEKIFDCFFAGCIPIYFGAPDIESLVPKETFLKYEDFENLDELRRYLLKMTSQEGQRYLDAAKGFLQSHLFDEFCEDNVAQVIFGAVEDCTQSSQSRRFANSIRAVVVAQRWRTGAIRRVVARLLRYLKIR